jgi:integrase
MARSMAGRRKNNPLGLEPRVYPKHGAFYYVHRNDANRNGRWERLGTDKEKANERARLYNDTAGTYGTMAYWLDMFIADCEQRVVAGTMAERTVENYRAAVVPLKTYFEPPMLPTDIEPNHVQDFLDIGAKAGHPIEANRQKTCLSSCLSWLIRTGKSPGLKVNPCFRVSGIKRNPESARDRYVPDDEYQDVYSEAAPQVKAMMELTYRTLQRPESDILDWTVANITAKDGARILRVKQSKTGKVVDIALESDLDALLRKLTGDVPKIGRPLICTSRARGDRGPGQRYTYDGISAMLKRAIAKANVKRKKEGIPTIPSFGFRDLKGKGATDMWLNGVPIEQIQLLCGHEDKATTEIYVKQRWRQTAMPNTLKIGGKAV